MGNCFNSYLPENSDNSDASWDSNYENIMKIPTTGANKTAKKNNLIPGINASHIMAKADLPNICTYRDVIKKVASEKKVDPALIAAIASRESGGQQHYWDEEWFCNQAEKLVITTNDIINKNPSWTKAEQLKGGIAAFNNLKKIPLLNMDEYTKDGDYANDVVSRAQWYRKQHVF